MKKKTLLVIAPGKNARKDSVFSLLVADTGECLASHLCSNYGFAKGDLYFNRPERIKEYKTRFGEVEIKFIDETGIKESDLIDRNKKWYNSLKKATT